jgi:hypothetical protein
MSKKKTIKQKQKVNVNVSTNVIINKSKRTRKTTTTAPKPVQQQQPIYIPIQSPQFDYSQINRLVSSEFNRLYEPLQSLKDYYKEALRIKTIDAEPIPTPEVVQTAVQTDVPNLDDVAPNQQTEFRRDAPEPAPPLDQAKPAMTKAQAQKAIAKAKAKQEEAELQQRAEERERLRQEAQEEAKQEEAKQATRKTIIPKKRGRPKKN